MSSWSQPAAARRFTYNNRKIPTQASVNAVVKNRHHGGRAIGPNIGPGLAEEIEQRSHNSPPVAAGISDPCTSVTTRRLTCAMTEGSCVATITVVPRALISLNSSMISPVSAGSKIPRRFVGQEHDRSVHDGPRNTDPLLLAGRQTHRQLVPLVFYADRPQRFRHFSLDVRL